MFSFFTISSPTTTLAEIGAWSSPFFNELLPVGFVISGLIVGGLLVSAVVFGVIAAFSGLVDKLKNKE